MRTLAAATSVHCAEAWNLAAAELKFVCSLTHKTQRTLHRCHCTNSRPLRAVTPSSEHAADIDWLGRAGSYPLSSLDGPHQKAQGPDQAPEGVARLGVSHLHRRRLHWDRLNASLGSRWRKANARNLRAGALMKRGTERILVRIVELVTVLAFVAGVMTCARMNPDYSDTPQEERERGSGRPTY